MWNDLFDQMIFLQSEHLKTLMPSLALMPQRYYNNMPYQMAGAVVSMLPMLIIYVFFKRQLINVVNINAFN